MEKKWKNMKKENKKPWKKNKKWKKVQKSHPASL